MNLWLVSGKGWGVSFNVVRARTLDDAVRVARERYGNCDVIPLPHEGEEAILWSYDHSPDTPWDGQ